MKMNDDDVDHGKSTHTWTYSSVDTRDVEHLLDQCLEVKNFNWEKKTEFLFVNHFLQDKEENNIENNKYN